MSNKEIPDIGEMYDFWQLKDEIVRSLNYGLDALFMLNSGTTSLKVDVVNTINKIEALGKKDKES
jgi:hypothetical protein